MRNVQFQIDYSYCPKGHGDWVFIPSSILYPDIFWCKQCDCFYEPNVRAVKRGKVNESFNSDREKELIERANFIEWRSKLQIKDMPK